MFCRALQICSLIDDYLVTTVTQRLSIALLWLEFFLRRKADALLSQPAPAICHLPSINETGVRKSSENLRYSIGIYARYVDDDNIAHFISQLYHHPTNHLNCIALNDEIQSSIHESY